MGVVYWKLNPNDYENNEELKKFRETRGYNYMDLLDLCPEKVQNYEQKLKNFCTEHIHQDEEIHYCLEGSGYFDVRDKDDRWIRIWIKAGDLIILPARIYHRFTLDTSNYVKDEEIHYCLEGSGYFDVRDKDDRWIRIWIKAGDLIILPARIYHRFTLDTNNYVKLMRLFMGELVWTPYNRSHEEHPARKEYIKSLTTKTAMPLAAH
ncbi:1,2-dihydroxy-3-keto-5-methylthiopentene dioxygenase 1 [Senna tora]|uniref:Acireductone dioxygenase n=1 Tax=Senna tora TaxID=362788 RepID=A0A834TRF3_9FABA|nr:1,2-dihydroxy-3-keto-5-methylthiopentene dioxygenase 1 [Senna tora]